MLIKVGAKGEGSIRGAIPSGDPWEGNYGTFYPFTYTIEVEGGDQFAFKANHKKNQPRFGDGDKVSFELKNEKNGAYEGSIDKAGFSGGGGGFKGGGSYSAPAKSSSPLATWDDLKSKYAELVPYVKAQLIGAGLEADASAVNAGVATLMIQAERLNIKFEADSVPF